MLKIHCTCFIPENKEDNLAIYFILGLENPPQILFAPFILNVFLRNRDEFSIDSSLFSESFI
jgi:hypothetical protein